MSIDDNAFFREATLRICGSLEVEAFLFQGFDYIRRFIPADTVFLTYQDVDKNRLVALAQATARGGTRLDRSVSLPAGIDTFAMRPTVETVMVGKARLHPTARPWITDGLLAPDASLLILRLIVEKQIIGAAVFHADRSHAFDPAHKQRVTLLREPFSIALSNCIRYRKLTELKNRLAEDNRFLKDELRLETGNEIIGADFGLRGVMEMVRQVAPLASPVLLQGATGTGKEVIAGAIHNLSPRNQAPFIKVNCGAIPESLMDSELFGHEKGAFTGALARKRGRFERADKGTIFLDEVAELRPEAQVRLLRVLQTKEIERVGGTRSIKVDIRVVAATHRDLDAMIRRGDFREDLYFRLKVFPIALPPLNRRKEDIPSLVHYFIQKKAREMGLPTIPGMAPGALERLTAYPWPGNVRELENAVERALILSRGRPLTFEEFASQHDHRPPADSSHEPPAADDPAVSTDLVLDRIVAGHIRKVLRMTRGKVGGRGGAAELMQINPSTLRKRMRKLGIPFGRKKGLRDE